MMLQADRVGIVDNTIYAVVITVMRLLLAWSQLMLHVLLFVLLTHTTCISNLLP